MFLKCLVSLDCFITFNNDHGLPDHIRGRPLFPCLLHHGPGHGLLVQGTTECSERTRRSLLRSMLRPRTVFFIFTASFQVTFMTVAFLAGLAEGMSSSEAVILPLVIKLRAWLKLEFFFSSTAFFKTVSRAIASSSSSTAFFKAVSRVTASAAEISPSATH